MRAVCGKQNGLVCVLCAVKSVLCDDRIERDVPRLRLQSVYPLRLMRKAEQEGSCNVFAGTFECEAAVVVAATHAQAMAAIVETEQRHDHQVEVACGDQVVGADLRFGDAEAVAYQRVARVPAAEQQPAAAKRVQYRQVTRLAVGRGTLEQRHRVEFSPDTEIPGDPVCTNETGIFQDLLQRSSLGLRPRLCREGETNSFEMLAECLAFHTWGRVATFPACAGTRRCP